MRDLLHLNWHRAWEFRIVNRLSFVIALRLLPIVGLSRTGRTWHICLGFVRIGIGRSYE